MYIKDMEKTHCITTGIGSLPLTDVEEACRLVLECGIGIPFWPQLPKRGFRELMIPQFSEGMPGVNLDEVKERIWVDMGDSRDEVVYRFFENFLNEDPSLFSISEGYAAGLKRFMELLEGRHYDYLKGQITGPITFTLGLADNNRRAIYYEEELRDIAVKLLCRKAEWQIELLSSYADKVIIFIDEPMLSAFGSSSYIGVESTAVMNAIDEIVNVIHQKEGVAGIHCCGNTDWSIITSTEVDIINFDAYHFMGSITIYPDAIRGFIERGGILAWGIVPTSKDIINEDANTLKVRIDEGMRLFESFGISKELLESQCLITPSCGTGSMEIDDARKVFSVLVELSRK